MSISINLIPNYLQLRIKNSVKIPMFENILKNQFNEVIDRRKILNPLITVVTPCLNAEIFVNEYLNALDKWKRESVEVIVIDGNSSDATVTALKRSSKIDLLVSGDDQGIFDAMNIGISLARGKYIGILNIDDRYTEGTIDLVTQLIDNNYESVIYGAMEIIGEKRTLIRSSHENIDRSMINHPTMFIPSHLYQRYGGFNLNYKVAADYDLTYRLIAAGVTFIESESILTYFQEGGFSSRHEFISLIESTRIQKVHQKRNLAWFMTKIILRIAKHIVKRFL